MLCDWILKRIKKKLMKLNMNNQGKNIQVHMALLYKATQHGGSASNFHKYCNNKGATLTLIRNTKGFRFGGFTTQSWSNSNNNKKDPYAFLFSLDYKEYYPSYDGEKAIYEIDIVNDYNYSLYLGNLLSFVGEPKNNKLAYALEKIKSD